MAIGVSTACWFKTCNVEDALRRIGDMGIKSAEVFLNTFSEYDPNFADMLGRTADESRVKIMAVHPQGIQFEGQLHSDYERSRRDAIKIFTDVVSCISKLGAKRYIYHGGMSLKHARNTPVNLEKIGRTATLLANIAGDYGVKLVYENVHWCWFSYPDFAHQLLEHTRSDNIYFNLDLKQAVQSGYAIDEYIDAMGKRLDYIHVCDTIRQDGFVEPRLPFEGETDFDALAGKLKSVNFRGDMTLEVYSDNYETDSQLKRVHEQMLCKFEDSV